MTPSQITEALNKMREIAQKASAAARAAIAAYDAKKQEKSN